MAEHLSLQSWRGVATQRQQDADQDFGVRSRLQPGPHLELHVFPGRSGPRRPAGAGRSSLRHRREGGSPAADATWWGRSVQNTFGMQIRNDDITQVGLYHTEGRVRLETKSDALLVTSAGVDGQNEVAWTHWFRTSWAFGSTRLTPVDSARPGEQRCPRAPASSARKPA